MFFKNFKSSIYTQLMPALREPHVAQERGQLRLSSACVSGESVSLSYLLSSSWN